MSEEQGKYTTNKQLNLSKAEIEIIHSSLLILKAIIEEEYGIAKSSMDEIDFKELKELNEMHSFQIKLIEKFEGLGEEDD